MSLRSVLLVLSVVLALLGSAGTGGAQAPVRLTVRVEADGAPLVDASVRAGAIARRTDTRGEAHLPLAPGTHTVRVERVGFEGVARRVTLGARDTVVTVAMEAHAEELEGIVVTSTRVGRRIEDEPVRVEVLGREEVEEKMLMTPGDVAMMLNETSGLRVQTTAPSLGGASVRVQGLRGRYTQILSDGLPLYGGQSGALSLLQIPPMDLQQVEVIKGAASALYGSAALGGVVNLVSRRPAGDREVLLNRTTRGGTDGVLWLSSGPDARWGYTLLGGAHAQARADVDRDGWADLPGYRRVTVRPRLFWTGGEGRSLLVTLGAMSEDRQGGTLPGRTLRGGSAHPEALATGRVDAGAIGHLLLGGRHLLSARASAMHQRHGHRFGERREDDRHSTGFAEATLAGASGAHSWLLGAALQVDRYAAEQVRGFDYAFTVPSLFAQDEVVAAEWLTLSASGRLDAHSRYGTALSPRLSALLRPEGGWTARLSVGTGYSAPTPFVEETEAVGLARTLPLEGLVAERARTASLDVGRTVGPVELNATLFASRVEDALQVRSVPGGRLALRNATAPTRTYGTELLARYHVEGVHLTATHTLIRSTEQAPEGEGRREVPLTPRHALGLVGMWEAEGRGRIGAELYFTGRQALEDNPYRERSAPYLVVGALAEWRVGRARLFLNAENLADARQSRFHPLVRPSPTPEGRWTTDAWAPLEGRVLNAGVRLEL